MNSTIDTDEALAVFVAEKTVSVEEIDRDRDGRVVARVTIDGRLVNAEIVRSGLAWRYVQFDRRNEFRKLEDDARRNRRGLWADAHPDRPLGVAEDGEGPQDGREGRGGGAVGERCGLPPLAASLSPWPSDRAYATDLPPVRATRRPIPTTGKAGYTPDSRTFFRRNAAVFWIRVCSPKGATKSGFDGDSNVDSLKNMRLEGKRMVSGHTGNLR
jgi:hypothetical protein